MRKKRGNRGEMLRFLQIFVEKGRKLFLWFDCAVEINTVMALSEKTERKLTDLVQPEVDQQDGNVGGAYTADAGSLTDIERLEFSELLGGFDAQSFYFCVIDVGRKLLFL